MAPEGVRNEGGNGKFDARRPPNPFCAKLAHSVRAENRSTENAQSASVPPPFPSPGSTPRSFLTPSRHLGPHTQAPRLRPPKPFIWEQQPALYASDRLFESRARAERRASTTLVTLYLHCNYTAIKINCTRYTEIELKLPCASTTLVTL